MPDTQPTPKKESTRNALLPNVPLPFLVEFAFTAARLTVLFAGILTTSLSLLANATPWIAVLRGSIAIIVTGLLTWMLVSLIGQSALEVAKAEVEKAGKEDNPTATLEKEA